MSEFGEFSRSAAVRALHSMLAYHPEPFPEDGDPFKWSDQWKDIIMACGFPLFGLVAMLVIYWSVLCCRNGCWSAACASEEYWPNCSWCPHVSKSPTGLTTHGCGFCGCPKYIKDPSRGCHAAWPRNNKKLARMVLFGVFLVVVAFACALWGLRNSVAEASEEVSRNFILVSDAFRTVDSAAASMNSSAQELAQLADCAAQEHDVPNVSGYCAWSAMDENLSAAVLSTSSYIQNASSTMVDLVADSDAVFDRVAKDLPYYFVAYMFFSNASFAKTPNTESMKAGDDLFGAFLTFFVSSSVVFGCIFGCCGMVGAVSPDRQFKLKLPVLQLSSNILTGNSFLGVFWLLVLAVALASELFVGISLAGFCWSNPIFYTHLALYRDHAMRDWATSTSTTVDYYLYCEGVNMLEANANATLTAVKSMNDTVNAYSSVAKSCNGTVPLCFRDIRETLWDLQDESLEVKLYSSCEMITSNINHAVQDEICDSLPSALLAFIIANGIFMGVLGMALCSSSFQRQAIKEAGLSYPYLTPGLDLPHMEGSAQAIQKASSLYYV